MFFWFFFFVKKDEGCGWGGNYSLNFIGRFGREFCSASPWFYGWVHCIIIVTIILAAISVDNKYKKLKKNGKKKSSKSKKKTLDKFCIFFKIFQRLFFYISEGFWEFLTFGKGCIWTVLSVYVSRFCLEAS